MNPYEERARRTKAYAIATYIWARMKPEERLDNTTAATMMNAGQDARNIVAREAEQRAPSEATWLMATKIIAEQIRAARWGHAHREGSPQTEV